MRRTHPDEPDMSSQNLFSALRAAFPADLDGTAIETADTPVPMHYTWRDLERGTAMLATIRALPCRWKRAWKRSCSTWRCCAPAMSTCR